MALILFRENPIYDREYFVELSQVFGYWLHLNIVLQYLYREPPLFLSNQNRQEVKSRTGHEARNHMTLLDVRDLEVQSKS